MEREPWPTEEEVAEAKVRVRASWVDHRLRETLGLSPVRHSRASEDNLEAIDMASVWAAKREDED